MKTLQFVWVVEYFEDGAWRHWLQYQTRKDARSDAGRVYRIYGYKTRIVKFIRSEG